MWQVALFNLYLTLFNPTVICMHGWIFHPKQLDGYMLTKKLFHSEELSVAPTFSALAGHLPPNLGIITLNLRGN
jgi:hypothetical protein